MSTNSNIIFKCDAAWSTEIFDTFKQYVDGKTRALTTGYGIGIGPNMGATALDQSKFNFTVLFIYVTIKIKLLFVCKIFKYI